MVAGEALANIAAARIEKIGDVKLSANWMAAAGALVKMRVCSTRCVRFSTCASKSAFRFPSARIPVNAYRLEAGGEKKWWFRPCR